MGHFGDVLPSQSLGLVVTKFTVSRQYYRVSFLEIILQCGSNVISTNFNHLTKKSRFI